MRKITVTYNNRDDTFDIECQDQYRRSSLGKCLTSEQVQDVVYGVMAPGDTIIQIMGQTTITSTFEEIQQIKKDRELVTDCPF